MRKLVLLLTIGIFLSATAANACDGDKATVKGKKASAACVKHMKNGKCTMTAAEMKKSGCCMHGSTASMEGCTDKASKAGMTDASGKMDAGCSAHGKTASAGAKHDCCKAKTDAAPKS